MNDESDRLRAENDRLTAELAKRDGEIAKQNEAIAKQNEAIAKLQHYLRRLLRGRFGRATEKILGIQATDQSLIAEIEAFLAEDRAAQSATPPPATSAAPAADDSSPAGPASTPSTAVDQTASAAAKRGSRQRPSATFPNLEVRDSVIDVPETQRLDSSGAAMIRCGDQVVETVVFTKPEVFIERVTYARYRSVGDLDVDGRAATAGVPVPERIVDGGMLADQTVQAIVIGKFADALPANRTLEIMARSGCRLSSSVVDAAVAAMGDLLAPMAETIRADLRNAPVVGVDGALMRCRDPALRRKCRRTPIYTVTDGTQAWYRWAPDETHAHAPEVVAGFFRWLITDGWKGWRRAIAIGARLAGCWAHGRRPFAQIHEIDDDAKQMVGLIHELYLIENRADTAGASLEERLRLRRTYSAPIVGRIRAFAIALDRKHPGSGGHPCGKGSRYLLNQWHDLLKFLDHPELRLDNNLAEGDLRMVALIRKNSLFLGAESAGPRAAACLSVIRSCRLARINPSDYLDDVVPTLIRWRRCRRARLPTPDLNELTPKRWGAERIGRIRAAC
ncbi:MAG: IS66 family transposase [Planctomycetes bacterium]|nr:IS66 family transposase [Planctomycetota bacterium]